MKILGTQALGLFFAALCAAQEGSRVYIAHCQQCHGQSSDSHAPMAEALKIKPWQDIVKTLTTGAMRAQGAQLSPEERIAVARYWVDPGPWNSPR